MDRAERLTQETIGCFRYDLKDHKHVAGEFATYDAFFNYSMAVKRLGEYEDTGKTPEEVLAMTNKLAELQAFVQNWHEGENV